MPRKVRVSTEGKPWAQYDRLSKAEAAEDRHLPKAERLARTIEKLDAQRAETTAWLEQNGLPRSDALCFRDAGLSASKPNVVRPDWDRMMELAQRGELGGIAIVAVDRFTRDVSTMEDLIRLAEVFKVNIGGPRAGNLDLTTYEGIQQARGMAVQAANESLATSFRIRGTLARKMKAGKPLGGGERCFGFERGGQVQRPAEVAIVREVARRMLAGESLDGLAAELNGRVDAEGNPLRTVRGAKWSGTTLSHMLRRHRYGGIVEHHGEKVGVIPGEPVLDRDTYQDVQATLAARRRGRRATGQFLLTGLVVCSKCKRPDTGDPLPMNGKTRVKVDGTKVRDYRCPVQLGGCGRSIMAKPVEDLVRDHMIDLLSDPDHAAGVIAEDAHLNEARAAQLAKLQAIEDQVTTLTVKWASGEGLSDEAFEQASAILAGRRAKLQATLSELAPAKAIEAYDAGADWDGEDVTDEERRLLIKYHRVTIAIGPQPKGQRWFTDSRVKIT